MSRKRIIWIGVIVVLVLAVLLMTRDRGDKAPKVYTSKAKARSIVETVSANGKVQPEVEVKLSADVSGEIVELVVEEGQKVKSGDFLAKINPDLTLAARDRAVAALNTQRANLANAKARLAQAKSRLINETANFDRNDRLFKQEAISEAEFQGAQAAYEVAVAEVEAAEESVKGTEFSVMSAEATVKEANDQLSRTSLIAPMDGTVSLLSIEIGERVVGTAQMAGTEVMRVADLTSMEVRVEVNENDIVRVSIGDPAEIEVDAYLDRKFDGVVTEIANTADSDPTNLDQVTTFNVKIRILPESYKDLIDPEKPHLSPFRPGMSASVEIETDNVKDALSVPIQAVTVREKDSEKKSSKPWEQGEEDNEAADDEEEEDESSDDEDKPLECVFLYVDGQVEKRLVETGVQDNKYIQIVSGLKAGEEVVAGPFSVVSKELETEDEVKKVRKSELYGDSKKKD